MSKQTGEDTRDALFATWTYDRDGAAPKPLHQWVREHPEYEADLVQWTTTEPVVQRASLVTPDPALEQSVMEIGASVLAKMRAQSTVVAPKSLIEQAKKQGLNPKKLAARLAVGLAVVGKLQQRLIQVSTIPVELVDRLADALDLSVAQVRAYLSLPATLASGADYKADAAPQVLEQEEFAQAILACGDMSDPQKTYWVDAAKKDSEIL